MKTTIFTIFLVLFAGCISEKDPEIYSTKPWEGHFYTQKDVSIAVESMNLENDESVWILSNRTLKRVLKNNEQETK